MDMRDIVLNSGTTCQVDDEDFERINMFHWQDHGTSIVRHVFKTVISKHGRTRQIGKYVFIQNEILSLYNGETVDHRDRSIRNNLRNNLRPCSLLQNCWNRSKQRTHISSPYKGISWHKIYKKYQARITHKGTVHHLGLHENADDAAKVYDEKATELFGEFAVLNFPLVKIK